jgi:hypothetical protein
MHLWRLTARSAGPEGDLPRGARLAIVAIAASVLGGLGLRYGSLLMLGDNFNYIAFWQQLIQHSFQTTNLETPKPLLILVFGTLYQGTGTTRFLPVLFIGAGILTIAAASSLAKQAGGTLAAVAAAVFLLLNGAFLGAVLSGASELLSTAVVLWLLARHVKDSYILLPDWAACVSLFALNLVRPENWIVSGVVAIATIVILVFRRLSSPPANAEGFYTVRRGVGEPVVCVLLPLAAPLLWMAVDHIAFGNTFFSFTTTAYFADVAQVSGARASPGFWTSYPVEMFRRLRMQLCPAVLVWSGIGALACVRRRPWLLVVLGAVAATTLATYFVAYVKGLVLYERFFMGPVVVLLILAGIGWAWTVQGVLGLRQIPSSPQWHRRLVQSGHLVAVTILALLALWPGRSVVYALESFDEASRSREGVLAAVELIRDDPDYAATTPVIMSVANQTLAAWILHSSGQNLIDTGEWLYWGGHLEPSIQIAYVVHEVQRDNDSLGLYSRLASNQYPNYSTRVLFQDDTVSVYKMERKR